MTFVIRTATSSLILHDLEEDKLELLLQCSQEVDNKLNDYPEIMIYGKPCRQNRSVGFFSNQSVGYRYSGQIAYSIPLTPCLAELLEYVNQRFSAEFNGILVNKYRTGEETIGKHSDDEKALDTTSGVICLSIGAIRKFRIREKGSGKIVVDVLTDNRKMIQMKGDFQKEFTHEIPAEKKIKDTRYSFTFRKHTE